MKKGEVMFFDCKYILEKEKELKPCPFCKGKVKIITKPGDYRDYPVYTIYHPKTGRYCVLDGVETAWKFPELETAIREWNRRASE